MYLHNEVTNKAVQTESSSNKGEEQQDICIKESCVRIFLCLSLFLFFVFFKIIGRFMFHVISFCLKQINKK